MQKTFTFIWNFYDLNLSVEDIRLSDILQFGCVMLWKLFAIESQKM